MEEIADKDRFKEMKKLEKENRRITKEINKLCDEKIQEDLWALIGDLIDNEQEQEELCGR